MILKTNSCRPTLFDEEVWREIWY